MTLPSQRQIFLDGEGDAWYERNCQSSPEQRKQWQRQDPLAQLLTELPMPRGSEVSALEVGCGQGLRLQWMHRKFGWQVAGVDPSSTAVEAVASMGLTAHVATADILPIPDASVDVLIYGFCLYLCDRSDLFKLAAEAHRVLKPESWLAIMDFWSPNQTITPYNHRSGILSYKDDYSTMFTWHPSYVIADHHLRHHTTRTYTDDPQEWVATTILRRCDLASKASHG